MLSRTKRDELASNHGYWCSPQFVPLLAVLANPADPLIARQASTDQERSNRSHVDVCLPCGDARDHVDLRGGIAWPLKRSTRRPHDRRAVGNPPHDELTAYDRSGALRRW
jgi:hypothetical protein